MEDLWPVITVVGPILLLAVLLWAMLRNRGSRADEREADAGARAVYAEEDRRTDT